MKKLITTICLFFVFLVTCSSFGQDKQETRGEKPRGYKMMCIELSKPCNADGEKAKMKLMRIIHSRPNDKNTSEYNITEYKIKHIDGTYRTLNSDEKVVDLTSTVHGNNVINKLDNRPTETKERNTQNIEQNITKKGEQEK